MMTTQQLEKLGQKGMRTLDIAGLKKFAKDSLPSDSALKEVLLAESDQMPVDVFINRFPVWLQLLKFEEKRR